MISSINACLNNGLEMPWLGFGVFQIDDGQTVEQAVLSALEVGYRSIDTAAVYKNESGVGKAIRESGVPREDIFLTTKVWNSDMRAGRTLAAFEESLDVWVRIMWIYTLFIGRWRDAIKKRGRCWKTFI